MRRDSWLPADIKVAPSILAADFSHIAEDIKEVEGLGIDFWHIDIMDGNFVPNLSIGPAVVRDLRPLTRLPFETHLMVSSPKNFIDRFVESGADIVTLHIETISPYDFKKVAGGLHRKGKKIGIALNPKTKVSKIKDVLCVSDMVLVMTVNPGFGGQKFIPEVVSKISQVRAVFSGDIAVDGGIDDETARLCLERGANVLACGTHIFRSKDRRLAIARLKNV